jgi:hypothetical protein
LEVLERGREAGHGEHWSGRARADAERVGPSGDRHFRA